LPRTGLSKWKGKGSAKLALIIRKMRAVEGEKTTIYSQLAAPVLID
jgi:hypothetical protein